MNIKKIVRYLELKSQLTTEELQMAETMVGLTESDKEALAGLLQPVKTKSKPTATKRVIEKCVGCDYTRRAAHHKEGHKDYHEFQSKKSARASSLSQAIKGTAGGNHQPTLCVFEIDGKVCHGSENDGIHDATMGYAAYHKFQSETAQAVSGG